MLKRKYFAQNAHVERETDDAEVNAERTADKGRTPRKRRFSREFILTLVLSLVFTVIVAIALSPLMNIDAVTITGNRAISDQHVTRLAGRPVGTNLFLYKKSDAVRALESHPYVKEVTIHRHLPHSLSISIKERRAVGVLVNRGIFLQFSTDGLLLNSTPTLENTSIPIITGISLASVPQPGGKIKNDAFEQALSVINAMPKELLGNIQEINVAKTDNILAYTSNGIEVRIGNTRKIDGRMSALNDIMNQIIFSNSIQGQVEYIDMRYSKSPILKLKGKDAADIDLDMDGASLNISAEREAQRVQGTTEAVVEEDPNGDNDTNTADQ